MGRRAEAVDHKGTKDTKASDAPVQLRCLREIRFAIQVYVLSGKTYFIERRSRSITRCFPSTAIISNKLGATA